MPLWWYFKWGCWTNSRAYRWLPVWILPVLLERYCSRQPVYSYSQDSLSVLWKIYRWWLQDGWMNGCCVFLPLLITCIEGGIDASNFFVILTHSFISAATMNYTVLKSTRSEKRSLKLHAWPWSDQQRSLKLHQKIFFCYIIVHGVLCVQASLMYDRQSLL